MYVNVSEHIEQNMGHILLCGKIISLIHSFTVFSIYPYTGRIPRMWKLS